MAHDPISQVVEVIVVVRVLDRLTILEGDLAEAFGNDVGGEQAGFDVNLKVARESVISIRSLKEVM